MPEAHRRWSALWAVRKETTAQAEPMTAFVPSPGSGLAPYRLTVLGPLTDQGGRLRWAPCATEGPEARRG